MPYIAWINEIFQPAQEPFTVVEIATKLQQLYHPDISQDAVYRAYHSLAKRAAIAAKVAPIDDQRPMLFLAEAARLIARTVTHNKAPIKFIEPVNEALEPLPRLNKKSSKTNNPNSVQLRRNYNTKSRRKRLVNK
jgi:hypothetical protein